MSEAKSKFDRWHLRQRELGACRCAECKAAKPVIEFRQPGFWFGDRSDNREIFLEPAALEGAVDQVLGAFERATDEELRTAGGLEFSANEEERADAAYRREVAAIGPPEPGEPDRRPYRDAYASWGKLAKAQGAGTYERNLEALFVFEKKLEARENEVLERQYRADDRECRAEKARLTYEQARAKLEAEFGAEVVGKSIAALERLLSFQAEFAQLGEQVEDVVSCVATVHSAVDELGDEASILVERFGKLKRKLDGDKD